MDCEEIREMLVEMGGTEELAIYIDDPDLIACVSECERARLEAQIDQIFHDIVELEI